GSGAAPADDDGPGHAEVDRADVVERVGAIEGEREGLTGAGRAGFPEWRAARGGVGREIVVLPGDGVADVDVHRAGLEADGDHADGTGRGPCRVIHADD